MGRHAAGRSTGEGTLAPAGEETPVVGEPADPDPGPGTRTFAALSPESLASHDDGPPRGFLGSGWNDRPEPPKRLRRVALVSGLSVLLAVGVTTGGVRLMAGRTTLTAEPPRQACASAVDCVVTGAPSLGAGTPQETGTAPQIGDAAGDAGGETTGGAAGDGAVGGRTGEDPARGDTGPGTPPGPGSQSASQPDSGPAGPGAHPGRTQQKARASASPKARATSPAGHGSGARTGAGSTPADVGAPATADAPGTAGTTDGKTDGADPGSPATSDASDSSEPGGAGSSDSGGEAPHTDSAAPAAAPGDGAVRVAYAVTGRRGATYTARLAVRNEGPALSSWTLRLPVGGRVIAVRGAAHWEQQEDTLVVTGESLGEDGEIGVVFDAEGSSRAPAECALAEGRCAVASNSGHHHR
ncbi:hypothetical protein F5972_21945 [Microbispora cellulosiformans]|uniref:CBM2 domain-containing protein n=1 Tax=Microbispora cellulosiformans TaxID=2614688 RepID=A0A5J5K325_9ACTN|nr:hypothetical protein [Microbispora cellulosiformans]KAA9377096.1 hypothetical protein F5972_21945 [Microbispora cellulosiformans]